MRLYFAPMEGVTDYIYRRIHHELFHGIDQYYTPFIATNQKGKLGARDEKGVLPEHNQGVPVIPQILSNHADQFNETAVLLREMGYQEVNLNLGCPSGTVTAKGKGAGFLGRTEELNMFLDKIFEAAVLPISVKTRIGVEHPDEFYRLLDLYNQYPIKELIIHPRVRTDFYKNKPNLFIFSEAVRLSKIPLCYNGDLFNTKEYESFHQEFNEITSVMIGRGLVCNPALAECISEKRDDMLTKERLHQFHEELYQAYRNTLFGEKNVLFRIKELWFYMIHLFTAHETYEKKIKKTQHLSEYEHIINSLFREQELVGQITKTTW
ncbi:MAG: tRNA-dihydrouridine synthase family protein [Clostridia bacterium]|nr:tRNA-dihydrouridine synthase family protein [Clostridia bacterium]